MLKAVKPITGVSLHLTATDGAIHTHWTDAIDILLKHYRVKPIDSLLVLHPENEDEYISRSVEIVAPVEERDATTLITQSEGRLIRCELPACPHMASVLHQGPPSLVMPAYQALGTWMEHNGYTIVGPRRKMFLRRGEHLDDTLTEIQFPVEKVV